MALFGQRKSEAGQRALPRGIAVRRGTEDDEFATFNVMGRAMSYEMNWAHHAATRHHLRTSPHSSYWVAEETPRFGGTRIVGYARSLVREAVWNLTEFFVLPDYHRKGIGTALLSRCLEDGDAAGATTRCVLASHHSAADSLYIRLADCYPRLPMLLLAGSLHSLRLAEPDAQPPIVEITPDAPSAGVLPAGTVTAEPLILTPDLQTALDALDREIVGYARPPEHAHWAALMGGRTGMARVFRRTETGNGTGPGAILGYAYIGTYSSGPALARDPADLPRMLMHVAALARAAATPAHAFARAPTDLYMAVAGTNGILLRWLLDCGWQIAFQYLFMSTRPFGRFDRYLCHNPLYLL